MGSVWYSIHASKNSKSVSSVWYVCSSKCVVGLVAAKVKAEYTYQGLPAPENGRPLQFNVGDVFDLMSEEDDYWWEVREGVDIWYDALYKAGAHQLFSGQAYIFCVNLRLEM